MTDVSFVDRDEPRRRWIVAQRWFGSKSREVSQIDLAEAVTLRSDAAAARARADRGALRRGDARDLPGAARAAAGRRGLDGARDRRGGRAGPSTTRSPTPRSGASCCTASARATDVPVEDGALRFQWAESASAGAAGSVEVRPVGVEQSNSSVVFGESLILKAFRRVEPGVNPELELLRFLSERGFPHIAPLAGWYEIQGRQIDATLGILQEYLAGARDGWELVLDGLRDDPNGLLDRLRALGEVTGELHTALGSEHGDPAFSPDEPSAESLALLTADDRRADRAAVRRPARPAETWRRSPAAGRTCASGCSGSRTSAPAAA